MTNDTSTLSGALLEMKDQLIYELGQKGVTATYSSSTGLLGLIAKIGDIQTGGGGSCYHIEFEQSSYIAVGGSATVSVYLQSNYAPLSGATVSVTGSDGSSYTCITNSNGIGSCTVTGITAETTFTASYSNVSDTCTVNAQSYLFYDECTSSTGLSNYDTTNIIKVNGTASVPNLSYDSGMNAYKLYGSGNYRSMYTIPTLNGLDNYKISMEVRCTQNNWLNSCGFGLLIDSTSNSSYCFVGQVRGSSEWRAIRYTINSTTNSALGSSDVSLSTNANGRWLKTEMIVNDTQITWKLYDGNGNLLMTDGPYTITDNNNHKCGLVITTEKGANYICYVRNIQAESL